MSRTHRVVAYWSQRAARAMRGAEDHRPTEPKVRGSNPLGRVTNILVNGPFDKSGTRLARSVGPKKVPGCDREADSAATLRLRSGRGAHNPKVAGSNPAPAMYRSPR